MNKEAIISSALKTIETEANAVAQLKAFVNEDFIHSVEAIAKTKGRLVVSGIGKSAIIAQKITATLNSTGTPALFMHAADAIHGDLGMIQQDDIVMVISKSGDSPEIKVLLPLLSSFGNTIIGMTGNLQSFLAQHAHYILNTTVEQEACPNNLAPTSSTTAQMVMGDALAVCLMELKQFNSADFAKYHPGGALGKKLYLRVSDILVAKQKPHVAESASIKEVIVEITKNRLGAVAVLNESGAVSGIITDGDLRRMLEKNEDISKLAAQHIMSVQPKSIASDALAAEAMELMRTNNINQLLVIDSDKYIGIIHIQDLLKEGII